MSKISAVFDTLRPYVNEGVKIILWFFLAATIAIFAVRSLVAIMHPYSLDYGEAPLIDQARRLANGQNIYRPDIETPPYTIANYPPIYVTALIPFLNWFDSPFHMGRVISLLASLLSAVFIGLSVYTFTGNRLGSLAAALLFLASPYVMQWSSLARIDSLALAFATGGIFVFVRWPDSRWGWVGGGLLLVAAAFTRQSYALAAPLAAFVWLWTHDKRRALGLALLVAGLGAVLFLLLNVLTDGGFFYNIVTANVNEFGWERLKDHFSRLWSDGWIILALSVVFLGIGWRSQKSWPLLAPFLVGAFLSALTIGKIGSNINYFLELAAALALIGGIYFVWGKENLWRNSALILLIAIQFGLYLRSTMNTVDWDLTPRRGDFTHLQFLEQEVKRMSDPVLADEYMGMMTMNDRPIYMQPFEVTQLANAGMWNQQPLLDEIRDQDFDGVLIHHFDTWPVYQERWSPQMLAAIDEYYRPAKTMAGTVIYIPKGGTEISLAPAAAQKSGATTQPAWEAGAIPVSKVEVLAEPAIAINPVDPDHLVMVATRMSKQDCDPPNCRVEMAYISSNDGGETWGERAKFNWPQQVIYNGLVAFDPDGKLYIMGIRNDVIVVNQASAENDYRPAPVNFEDATRAQVNARPWLRVHPETGELFLTMDAQENNLLFVTPSLKRSDDGVVWSITSRADQRVSASDIFSPRATGPDDIQALFGVGEDVSLVWTWDPRPWSWPRSVWLANSNDGGVNFGEPSKILETRGPINSASGNGTFAIVYRTGREEAQQLAVAVSSDNGGSWTSAVASGGIPLYFDIGTAPGIGIAPDGTIDLVFYAHDSGSTDCVLDLDGWRETLPLGRVDPCEYNVYYTFSKDGGLTFAEPVQLNSEPIRGEDFPRFGGGSYAGSHLSVASGERYAYPMWIETPNVGKTQVFTAKIER